jgi:hypothetical protein
VGGIATTTNTLGIAGHSASVQTIRWVALGGFVLALAVALATLLFRRAQPFEEAARIQEQYGHLIVPIMNADDLGWPPIDVPNMRALARLADSGERLILHHRGAGVDTYLVNDDGTVYRYQRRRRSQWRPLPRRHLRADYRRRDWDLPKKGISAVDRSITDNPARPMFVHMSI